MTMSFKEFLVAEKVDSSTIQQAGRYYVAEKTNDLSPSKLRDSLVRAGADANVVGAAIRELEGNPTALENSFLALLSAAWDDEGERAKVRDAIVEARGKLPIIELGILAIVATYAMYLFATGGVAKRTVVRRPDGSFAEEIEYHPPTAPLDALVKDGAAGEQERLRRNKQEDVFVGLDVPGQTRDEEAGVRATSQGRHDVAGRTVTGTKGPSRRCSPRCRIRSTRSSGSATGPDCDHPRHGRCVCTSRSWMRD